MGYEQDEPYVVTDESGEYVTQTPTKETAQKHLIEHFTHQDAVYEHIGTGNNATIDLIIAVAEFDLEHPDLYKFQPTAEWSRITQALKERDELAAEIESLKSRLPVNADGDVVLWGDEVWYWDPVENKPMGGKCHSFECLVGEGEFEIGVFVEVIDVTQDLYNSELFTTAESCRAAHSRDTNTD